MKLGFSILNQQVTRFRISATKLRGSTFLLELALSDGKDAARIQPRPTLKLGDDTGIFH